jgi:hypothetical protein
MRTLEDRATAVLSYVTVGAEEKAIIRAQQAEIAKLRTFIAELAVALTYGEPLERRLTEKLRDITNEQIGKSEG